MGRIVKGEKRALGNKGGGRKSKAEELEKFREEITSECLVKLANRVLGKKLLAMDKLEADKLSNSSVKDLAVPISLKGISENIKFSGEVKVTAQSYGKSLEYIRGRKASGKNSLPK